MTSDVESGAVVGRGAELWRAAVQRAQSLSLQADTDDRDGRLAAGGRAATLAFALGEMADNLGEVRHAAARLVS